MYCLKITWIIFKIVFFLNAFSKSIIDFFFSLIIFFWTDNNENLSLEEENIVKDVKNLLRLKKGLNYTEIKGISNLFRLEKQIKGIKDRILRDITSLFEHEEEQYF